MRYAPGVTIGDWRVHLLVGLCALSLLGCGGGKDCALDTDCRLGERCTDDHKCVPRGGDAGDGEDAGDGGDAGDGEDAGVDAGFDAGPGVVGVGSVVAVSEAFGALGMETPSFSVSASFALDDGSPDPCRRMDMGACDVTTCPDTTPAPPDGGVGDAGAGSDGGVDAGASALPTAGLVTVTGLEAVSLMADAGGVYPPASGARLLWDTASPNVRMEAAGAEVPAFDETLMGAAQVALTGPGLSGMVDRGTDLVFTWMGTSPGEVVVRITAPGEGTAFTAVECRFDPTTNSGTVPAAALASFAAGSTAAVSVSTENSTVVEDSGWTVTLLTRAGARSGSTPATGSITFN